eukprot:CCRYP_005729-RA/>CCRYP_005729-RA protein AED:0.71 eAED:0.71 QI:0/0/0/0.5/1/1/2/0/350
MKGSIGTLAETDLESILGVSPTSPAADQWSFSAASEPLSHLVSSGVSFSSLPWIQSVCRDTSGSVGLLRRFLSACAPSPVEKPLQLFVATSSLASILPSAADSPGNVTWGSLGWRFRRLLRRLTQRHEAIIERFLHASHLAAPSFEPPADPSVPHFVDSFDPALAGLHLLMVDRFDKFLQAAPPRPQSVSINLQHNALPITLESAYSMTGATHEPPLIVDSGASCCISPCKCDFQSYSSSSAQIKDLSGTNAVAGEGLIRWKVLDRHGRPYIIEVKGYHIPKATVRLLSPQTLYKSVGGHGIQDITKYSLALSNETTLDAPYGRANLPILPMCSSDSSCFWSRCCCVSSI